MREAVGGSMLLYLVVIFTSVVILFFVGIISYSKAYKVKNRIIEIVESYEQYNELIGDEISQDLKTVGYRTTTRNQVDSKCKENNLNSTEYLYCIYKKTNTSLSEGYYYEVVTYVHFDFPVIGDMISIPVKGETKILGKVYDY